MLHSNISGHLRWVIRCSWWALPVFGFALVQWEKERKRQHVFHLKSCKFLDHFWMSATTYVIVSGQCLIFSLPNLSQYHQALFKVTVSFDQTQNFMTAAEPPGLHSLAAWWGLLRQNSFRYCVTQFLQWRHRLSLSASGWLTPTTLLSSNIAFLMQTNADTSAVSTILTGSREWEPTMGGGLRKVEGMGWEFLRAWAGAAHIDQDAWLHRQEFVWSSSPPAELLPACRHQDAVRSQNLSQCLLSFLPPHLLPLDVDTHTCTNTHAHTHMYVCMYVASTRTHIQ